MSIVYAMIKSEVGYEAELMEELKKIPCVQEVYQVYGVYDIILKMEAESMKELKETVSFRLRRLKKVRSLLILICV